MARAGLTRERLTHEAALLADEVGLERLTLAALAQRFGVAQPSLYKHVGGLDGIRRELAILGVRELTDAVALAAAGKSRLDALRAVADAYRDYATRRPGPYTASLRAPDPGDEEHLLAAAGLLGFSGAVVAGYGIEGDDQVDALRYLRAALHGFVALEAAGGTKMPRSNDASFHRMVAAIHLAFDSWHRTAGAAS